MAIRMSRAPGATAGLAIPAAPQLGQPGYGTWRQPHTTRPVLCIASLGAVAAEGTNGHQNIDLSSNANSIVWPTGYTVSYAAVRHENDAGGTHPNIGFSMPTVWIVPAGWSYRIRQETISGFAAPTYAFGNSGVVFEYVL